LRHAPAARKSGKRFVRILEQGVIEIATEEGEGGFCHSFGLYPFG
jgi:hypothetical protein